MQKSTREEVNSYKGIIIYFAKKYRRPGHPYMDMDDLIQEGWLVYSRCKERYGNKPKEDFDRLLMKSIANHLNQMSNSSSSGMDAVMVDLDEEFENLGYEQFNNLLFQEALQHLNGMLGDTAKQVLQELIEPSEEVVKIARIDYLRKRKLRSQGFNVYGGDNFKVLDKHIANHLKLPRTMMSYHRDEIRIAAIREGLAV